MYITTFCDRGQILTFIAPDEESTWRLYWLLRKSVENGRYDWQPWIKIITSSGITCDPEVSGSAFSPMSVERFNEHGGRILIPVQLIKD